LRLEDRIAQHTKYKTNRQCFACSALLCIVLHGLYLFLFCVYIISLSVSLLDISRTLIINYRWPAAIGLVLLWQPAKYV